MTLELNDVLLEGEQRTISLMVHEHEIVCISAVDEHRLTRWLHAVLGFESVKSGYISLDGEPLTAGSAAFFRTMMAFVPDKLVPEGSIVIYDPPSVQDVFSLKANRDIPISNGILSEEMRKVSLDHSDDRVRLLAVAALLDRPLLLVDNPPVEAANYLLQQAQKEKTVLITSNLPELHAISKCVVEL